MFPYNVKDDFQVHDGLPKTGPPENSCLTPFDNGKQKIYYLDYKNKRGEFINNFWDIVNWKEVEDRLKKVCKYGIIQT